MYKDLLGKEARALMYCVDVTIIYNNFKSPTSPSDFFILILFQIKKQPTINQPKNMNYEKNVLKLH